MSPCASLIGLSLRLACAQQEAEAETKKFFERFGLQMEYGLPPACLGVSWGRDAKLLNEGSSDSSNKQTSKLLQSRFVDHGFWMGPRPERRALQPRIEEMAPGRN